MCLKAAAGRASVRAVPGRNDPCPCGSGKKYKRCCAGVASAADREHRRLASEVTRWAEAQHPGTIEASYREFRGEYEGSVDADVEFIATWFLHEWELPGGGTPLERYAESGTDESLRALAEQLAAAKLNLWRVIEVFPGTSLVIEPFTSGERARITSTNISTVVGPWDLILGRLRTDAMELWGRVAATRRAMSRPCGTCSSVSRIGSASEPTTSRRSPGARPLSCFTTAPRIRFP